MNIIEAIKNLICKFRGNDMAKEAEIIEEFQEVTEVEDMIEPETTGAKYVNIIESDKELLANIMRTVVKYFNDGHGKDEYIEYMKEVSQPKKMRTFSNIALDDKYNVSKLVFTFTQSKAYNELNEFCKFINNSLAIEFMNKVCADDTIEDSSKYVVHIVEDSSSVEIFKIAED